MKKILVLIFLALFVKADCLFEMTESEYAYHFITNNKCKSQEGYGVNKKFFINVSREYKSDICSFFYERGGSTKGFIVDCNSRVFLKLLRGE